MHKRILSVAIFVSFFVAPAYASGVDPAPSLAEIREQQYQLRAEAEAGTGVFEDMDSRDRQRVLSRQQSLLALIEGHQSIDELGAADAGRVFNQLEEIKSIVEGAEEGRMVCEYEKRIGSNMKQRVCKTVAQRREEMRNAQEFLDRGGNCRGNLCTGN